MKPKYILLSPRNLDGYFVVKRLSGGSAGGGWTITKYEVLYPQEIDTAAKRRLDFSIRGDGRSLKGTIYSKDKFHDHPGGIIKDVFEKVPKK